MIRNFQGDLKVSPLSLQNEVDKKETTIWVVWLETLKDFANKSSVASFKNSITNQSKIFQVIWALLFAIGAILTIKDVLNVIFSYYIFPFTIQVSVIKDCCFY